MQLFGLGASSRALLGQFLSGQQVNPAVTEALTAPGRLNLAGLSTPELDQILVNLNERLPETLMGPALQLRRHVAGITRGRDRSTDPNPHSYTGPITGQPLISAKRLAERIAEFTAGQLRVDWESGPPYERPSNEVDPGLTLNMWAYRERINYRALTNQQLKDPDTRVMWSLAPTEDFTRLIHHPDGETVYTQRGYDVMGAMTFVNPDEEQLFAISPSYAQAFLEAAIPPERGMEFLVPQTFEEFVSTFDSIRPELMMLSGVGMNTRALLKMAQYARANGALEVWLGNYAAGGPYRILHEAFDRVFWGVADDYVATQLTESRVGHVVQHPPVDRMLSDMDWIFPLGDEKIIRRQFQTLHLAARLGCNRPCNYCAETDFSGGIRGPSHFDRLKELIDEAAERHIRHVYFIDPNFGIQWRSDDDVEPQIIRYLHSKRIKFSILTEVAVLKKFGQFMAEHGLVKVFLGIESLSPSHEKKGIKGSGTLALSLNRGQQKLKETEAIALEMDRLGVSITGLYMLGNPGESIEQIDAGIERLAPLVANSQISTMIPFPGTEQFFEGAMRRWIHNYDPDVGLNYGFVPWAPGGVPMDPDALRATWIRAHERINLIRRPGGFLDRNSR